MGEARRGYSIMKLLGVQGKRIDIIPTTKGECLTEVYNKEFEYLGALCYDKRVRLKKFVLVDLNKEMQMSLRCLKEAFEMTEKYWEKTIKGDKVKET